MFAIEIKNLKYSYDGNRTILDGINFNVEKGTVAAVIGESGCGKSTLCHILCGIIPGIKGGEISGDVLLMGDSIKNMSIQEISIRAGFVMQDPDRQIVTSAVEDELAFGPENLCVEPEVIRARVDEVMEFLGIKKLRYGNPGRLSGGQKQLVAIGSVLTMEPEIVILDEPFSHLDRESAEAVKNAVHLLKKAGKTVVVVEHDYDAINDADKWALMENGRISRQGTPTEVRRYL